MTRFSKLFLLSVFAVLTAAAYLVFLAGWEYALITGAVYCVILGFLSWRHMGKSKPNKKEEPCTKRF